jgi:hypothetical protein
MIVIPEAADTRRVNVTPPRRGYEPHLIQFSNNNNTPSGLVAGMVLINIV